VHRNLQKALIFGLALTLMATASNSYGLDADNSKKKRNGSGSEQGMSLDEAAERIKNQGCHILKARRREKNDKVAYVFKCLMPGGKVRTIAVSPFGESLGE